MKNAVKNRKTVIFLGIAVLLMLFIFIGTDTAYAESRLQKPYDLKADGKYQDHTLTWKCPVKGAKYRIYRKGSAGYKYVKTVKTKHTKVHIKKSYSYAVMAVKGNRSSALSRPVSVKCWWKFKTGKFFINNNGKIVTAR
ncbi:MAG: hypothetical protein ACI4LM_01255, partial [Anaerovoracaceae bacterium]